MKWLVHIKHKTVLTLLILALSAGSALAHPHILRATDRDEVSKAELLRDLASVQVIFFGELHDQLGHHEAQLSIIRALQMESSPVAIGLEMFRKDSQNALDLWVGGSYPINNFLKDYNENWSMWGKYREIFEFARRQKVKMIGLNIPRELSSKVARNGFAALPARERQALGNVQCVVNPEYADFIRLSMGGHGGHGNKFVNFCEAQLLWDTMMARNLVEFLKANPEFRVIVLAGSGHAWKFGIPRQLLEQMEVSYRVVLPEVDGRLTRNQVVPDVADYLWLDEGMDGWRF
ncbi:MAG: ChaN family lipoprotein [Desulfuromonadales bacterium]|nr:ChaN family lipoprotein [Desulfuromonadales bacterium]